MRDELHIAPDHPAFAGHFPGFPVFPGAALLDLALTSIARTRDIDVARWRLASAKFLSFVRPGDTPLLEHESAGDTSIRFTVRVDGRMVASGSLARERAP